jgi:hypothetical protein
MALLGGSRLRSPDYRAGQDKCPGAREGHRRQVGITSLGGEGACSLTRCPVGRKPDQPRCGVLGPNQGFAGVSGRSFGRVHFYAVEESSRCLGGGDIPTIAIANFPTGAVTSRSVSGFSICSRFSRPAATSRGFFPREFFDFGAVSERRISLVFSELFYGQKFS